MDLKAREGDTGKTGGVSPGKVIAILSGVIGLSIPVFWGVLFVMTEAAPFDFVWVIAGPIAMFFFAIGAWWGLAKESFRSTFSGLVEAISSILGG